MLIIVSLPRSVQHESSVVGQSEPPGISVWPWDIHRLLGALQELIEGGLHLETPSVLILVRKRRRRHLLSVRFYRGTVCFQVPVQTPLLLHLGMHLAQRKESPALVGVR